MPSSCQLKLQVCDSHPSTLNLLRLSASILHLVPLHVGGAWVPLCLCLDHTTVSHSHWVLSFTWRSWNNSLKFKISVQCKLVEGICGSVLLPGCFTLPSSLQQPAVAYPKGYRAFSSTMCGKWQQLYVCLFSIASTRLHGKLENARKNKVKCVHVKIVGEKSWLKCFIKANSVTFADASSNSSQYMVSIYSIGKRDLYPQCFTSQVLLFSSL